MADELYCWDKPYQHFLGYHLSRQLKRMPAFLGKQLFLSCALLHFRKIPVLSNGNARIKAWRIAMLFDRMFKLNLNLMGRKRLFFRTVAYWEHTKILSQMCVVAMQWVSVPQRATDYLHGHSGLDVPVKHIHLMCRLCRASKWESL